MAQAGLCVGANIACRLPQGSVRGAGTASDRSVLPALSLPSVRGKPLFKSFYDFGMAVLMSSSLDFSRLCLSRAYNPRARRREARRLPSG